MLGGGGVEVVALLYDSYLNVLDSLVGNMCVDTGAACDVLPQYRWLTCLQT